VGTRAGRETSDGAAACLVCPRHRCMSPSASDTFIPCKLCRNQVEPAADGAGAPRQPPPATPPPVPAGAPPTVPPQAMIDALCGGPPIGGADFARFDGELDCEMGRQFEVRPHIALSAALGIYIYILCRDRPTCTLPSV